MSDEEQAPVLAATEPGVPPTLEELEAALHRSMERAAQPTAPPDTDWAEVLREREMVREAAPRLAAVWQAAPAEEQLHFWADAFVSMALDAEAQQVLTAAIDSGTLGPEARAEALVQRAALYPEAMEDAMRADAEAALATLPGSPVVLRRAGQIFYDLEDYARSAELAGRAAAMNPQDAEALQQQMEALLALDDHPGVGAALDRLLQLKNRDLDTITLVATTRDEIGQHEEAIAALEWGEAVAGDDPDQLLELAEAYDTLDEASRALKLYARARQARPEDSELIRLHALARYGAGETDEALDDLDELLEQRPDDPIALLGRAELRLEESDYAGAVEDAGAVLAQQPHNFQALSVRARSAMFLRESALALADFEHMQELHPAYMPGYIGRAAAHSQMGHWDDALEILDEGLARWPDAETLLTTHAMFLMETGDHRRALDDWTRLSEIFPDSPEIWVGRGNIHGELNDHASALADFDHALELAPDNLDALRGRLAVMLHQDNVPASLQVVNRILTIEADDTHMLLLRGHLLMRREDLPGAIVAYTQAAELDPENATPLGARGNVRMLQGDYVTALLDYERALRLDPQSAPLIYNVAAAEASLGRCPQAVELLRRAAAIDPQLVLQVVEDEFFEDCRTFPGYIRLLRELAAQQDRRKPGVRSSGAARAAPPPRPPRGKRH